MTSGMRKTEFGWEFTRKALGSLGVLIAILSTVVGLIAGTVAWRTQTAAAVAQKVDERRFIAESVKVAQHDEVEQLHYRDLLDLVSKTETRVSDIWCEDHFKGAPPRSCQ